jgi:hypothetical protein
MACFCDVTDRLALQVRYMLGQRGATFGLELEGELTYRIFVGLFEPGKYIEHLYLPT